VLLAVFVTVQNLVEIGSVVLIISKFNDFCLFTPILERFFGDMTPSMGSITNGTPKGTSLRGTTPFDVSNVKIGAAVSALASRKNPQTKKKQKRSPVKTISRIRGSKTPERIVSYPCIVT